MTIVRKAVTKIKDRPSRIHMSGLHLEECLTYARTLGQLDVQGIVAAARGRADRAARISCCAGWCPTCSSWASATW